MFQSIQRRASRIGAIQTKVILTIDLQTLELYHDEYLYPNDALISLTLERGSKFSTSSEREMGVENVDVNPLNKRTITERKSLTERGPALPYFSSSLSKIEWNERLELVATLYKDVGGHSYQQKDAVVKIKLIQKADKLKGYDKSVTVGKFSIQLDEIMNQMLAASASGGERPSVPTRVYEREITSTFQPNFSKTSLTYYIRVTPLQQHPSFSNPFNQFIYSVNAPSSHLDMSHTDHSSAHDDHNGDNASVSSHESGTTLSVDVGFEYSDLKEARPVSVQTPSGTIPFRRTSLLGTPLRRDSGNQSEDSHQYPSTGDMIRSGSNSELRDHFYSNNYKDKGASKRLEGRRSMIHVSPSGSYHHTNPAGAPISPPTQTLKGLFPNASNSEDFDPTIVSVNSSDIVIAAPRSPKHSPKGSRKSKRSGNAKASMWLTAMFRTLAQDNQIKANHIERLESELHLMNQTNYIEKLELIKKLEGLQHDMSMLKLQAASAATAVAAASVAKSKNKQKKNESKSKPKKSRSFFSSQAIETIPETDHENTPEETTTTDENPHQMLAKTLQTAEETIESFRRSIDSNIQVIQQISMIREDHSMQDEIVLEDDEMIIGLDENTNQEMSLDDHNNDLHIVSYDETITTGPATTTRSSMGRELPQTPSEEEELMIPRNSMISPSDDQVDVKGGKQFPAFMNTDQSKQLRRSTSSTIGNSRSLSFFGGSSSSSMVTSSKYVPLEKYQLLEYELNHCKQLLRTLEQGRIEDQTLIREVANRVTENCLKRANAEWELEKARNQLMGYRAQNEIFKDEYQQLQKKYYLLKGKMKKARQKYTNLEVQYEYRQSLQDGSILGDITPRISNEGDGRPTVRHDQKKELAL